MNRHSKRKTMTKEIELSKQHGIQYRLTPEGTTEMWCYDRNVQAFAEALVAAERRRWLETVQHAATELAELDDETAQAQAAALMRLCAPNFEEQE